MTYSQLHCPSAILQRLESPCTDGTYRFDELGWLAVMCRWFIRRTEAGIGRLGELFRYGEPPWQSRRSARPAPFSAS